MTQNDYVLIFILFVNTLSVTLFWKLFKKVNFISYVFFALSFGFLICAFTLHICLNNFLWNDTVGSYMLVCYMVALFLFVAQIMILLIKFCINFIKPNKPLNLIISVALILSQTTLQASLLPNSQILQSNLNSVSIPQTNKSIKGSKFNSNSNTITNKASNLKANNINLSNKKDTTITGSNLIANNDININTNNLFINASQDSYNYNDKTKELSGSIDYTIYGGGGGTLGLNYSQSHSDQENLINNNSQIIANKE